MSPQMPMVKKQLMRVLSRLTLLTQLGLTFITPPLLLLLAAMWLEDRFGVGEWIVVPALLIGLLSGGCGAYGLLAAELRKDRQSDGKTRKTGDGKETKGTTGHET